MGLSLYGRRSHKAILELVLSLLLQLMSKAFCPALELVFLIAIRFFKMKMMQLTLDKGRITTAL